MKNRTALRSGKYLCQGTGMEWDGTAAGGRGSAGVEMDQLTRSNWSLPTPHNGQVQSAGTSVQAVPGTTP